MGLRIQNNIEAFNAHRQLSATATQASKSMEKLSSGYRINRAADDAAGLAISEKMRGQIGGLAQAQRNAQDGISLVQTAEGALNEVHSMLQRVRDLKVQFANGTLATRDQAAIASRGRADRQGSQHDRDDTKFNGTAAVRQPDFTFQVGANDGETISDAATGLSLAARRRHHRRPVEFTALGRRDRRRLDGATRRRLSSSPMSTTRSRTSPPSAPTTARSRTAWSTVWRTWRPTRRT